MHDKTTISKIENMKSVIILVLIFTISFFNLSGQTATPPASGDGSESSPYQIATLNNLYWLSQNSSEWDKYFIQTADIDANTTSTWNSGEGWSPIGNGGINFSGSYDGKGHIISNLYANRSEYYQGLFGLINNAEVKNLGLENIDITGDRRTGAIAGSNHYSIIEYCYTTGNVSSSADMIGGIVGENLVNGKIINCFSRCAISASFSAGGITGSNGNGCEITNCYSTGIVTGSSFFGGISGYGYNVATNCFWDTITSGIGTSNGGTGITTAEMTDLSTYTDLTTTGLDEAWDFPGYPNDDNGSASIWEIDAAVNNGYPTLSWQYASAATIIMRAIDSISTTQAYITCDVTNTGGTNITAAGVCWNTSGTPDISDATSDESPVSGIFQTSMTGLSAGGTYYVRAYVTNSEGTTYGNEIVFKTTPASGSGTEADPYVISSMPELAWLMGNQNVWDQHFFQSADIEASETQNWFAKKGFYPIGLPTKMFTGSYNGQGHAIVNLSLNRSDEEYVGLFGKAYLASFDSITLTNISLVGQGSSSQYLGSIAAYASSSEISNCSSSGNIKGDGGGGIVGFLDGSFVDGCYSNCTLNCNQTGGIVAHAEGSSVIKNSNSEGAVNGITYTGGLVGFFRADSILNCFSNATVTGENIYTGGLIGYVYNAVYIGNCYTTNNVQGENYVGGLLGLLNQDSYIEECYSDGTASGGSYIGGLIGSCGTNNTLINCYSHSNVTASSASAGGLIGLKGTHTNVFNCYSTGSVSASSGKGGLIGASYAGTIENCFWDTQTSGLTYSSGGTGKTTAELKDTTTFTHETTNGLTTAWDFFKNPGDDNAYQDIWYIDPAYNNGYPFFVQNLIAEVQTVEATNIGIDSLTSGGIIIREGSSSVIERGICWSTNSPPTPADNKIVSGMGLGEFSENLTNLDTITTYYIRAYAINTYDTAYGLIDTATTLKATQTITFNPIENVTYGSEAFKLSATTNSGLTITYTSSNPAVAEISNDTVNIIGTGTTNITASQAESATYYAADDVIQSLTVLKDTVWVTAHDKTKQYGATNPELTYSYTEFAYNEDSTVLNVQPSISTTVNETTNAGTEEIVISGAEDDNYFIYHVNGTFTILKGTLTVTVNDQVRQYGATNPEFTLEYSGFVNSEDTSVIDEEPAISTIADTYSDVGSYEINLSGGNDNNYAFTLIDGTLTIEKATLNASAVDTTRNYGEPNPEFRIEYTGFANDDDYSFLDEPPVASTSADINSDAGAYNITLSGGVDNNYLIYLFDGTLTINKADQEITFNLPDSVALESGFTELIAETTSGLEISYESSDPSIAYIDGNVLRLSSLGTCTISAIQGGDLNYNPARIDLPFKVYSGTNIFNDYAGSEMKVYPNPIEDILFIESNKNIERIEIYDLFGKKLKLFVPSANFINLSDLKQGMYLLRIYDGKSNSLFKVFKK